MQSNLIWSDSLEMKRLHEATLPPFGNGQMQFVFETLFYIQGLSPHKWEFSQQDLKILAGICDYLSHHELRCRSNIITVIKIHPRTECISGSFKF